MPNTACPGICNRRARNAISSYTTALTAWTRAAEDALAEATADAQTIATAVTVNDLTPDLVTALGLPQRPEPPRPEWNAGTPIWCDRDRATISRALPEIDRLASLLDQWADGHRGATSGERVSRSSSAPASPSPIAVTLDSLYQEMTDVEDEWRQARRYPRIYRGTSRGAHHRSLAIAFMQEHLDEILAREEYTEFGGRILKWERLLLAQTRSEPVVRSRPGRCPRCQLVHQLRTRDDGYTECQACGRLLDEDEYQRDVVGGADATVIADSKAGRA